MTDGGRRDRMETTFVLAAFMLSGAAALIYEVTWTRALSLVLGSTVYALSTMLSTFMAGLAIGAYLCGKYCDRNRNQLFVFGLCELGIGISGLLSIPLIYTLPTFYLYIYRSFKTYPPLFFAFQILLCVLVMLVPTVLMGATFPLVSKRITLSMDEMGNKVGKAYSVNTLGAVLGSLAAGFFLIPAIGLKGTAMAAASLNTIVAIAMLTITKRNTKKVAAAGLVLLAFSALYMETCRSATSFVNFYTIRRKPDSFTYDKLLKIAGMSMKEVFSAEPPEGQVRAFRSYRDELILQVGGKIEGTAIEDIPNTLMLSYLPIAAHARPESFLDIGLGAGITLAAAKRALGSVDVVEINPMVIEAVRHYGLPDLLDDVKIIHNDARNYLMRTEKKYDIISSTPSYPTEAAVSSLFTREFFEIAASRLNRHGILCQWLPFYLLTEEDVDMMAKTFGSVFPNTYVWRINTTNDLILLGSLEPFLYSMEEIKDRVGELNVTGYDLDYSVVMSPKDVRKRICMARVPVNTDDKPILEFHTVNNMLHAKSGVGKENVLYH